MIWAGVGFGFVVVSLIVTYSFWGTYLDARRHDRELRRRPDYGKIARLEQELFGQRFIDTSRERKVTSRSAADEILRQVYKRPTAKQREWVRAYAERKWER